MGALQKYMDRALGVLEKYGLMPKGEDENSQLASLLQDVVTVDEPKVLAIAKTLKYMGNFNQLVRDNVGDMNIATRYNGITERFTSIRDDSKMLVAQLQDGKIDLREKIQNWWMKTWRGTPHKRFEEIKDIYTDVAKDTKGQLDKEQNIMDAYIDFRFAVKEAETIAYEVKATQKGNLEEATTVFKAAVEEFEAYKGDDEAQKSRLQMKRDEADRTQRDEDKKYQLITDVAENLKIGYNVGETLIAKLQQTHGVKEQVYRKSVAFFTTNEHVFTVMDAVYTSQHGLHEATETLESMKEGANKGLEDIAGLGRELEKAAVKAGYGATLNSASVQKLVDSIVAYQEESQTMIKDLREESEKNAEEIEKIVEDGKSRVQKARYKFITEGGKE